MPNPTTTVAAIAPLRPSALFWRTLVYVSLSLNAVFFLTALTFWINITVRWEKRVIYALLTLTILAVWLGWRQRKTWPEHGWALVVAGIFMTVIVLNLLILYNWLLSYVVNAGTV